MKPNNNNLPQERRSTSRAISPSFRTGPRQRPSDASTDEIVRFVREYQRCKPPPSVQTISAMKTKAVLPSIERKRSNLHKDQHQHVSMSFEEDSRHSFDSTNNMDIDCRYSTQRMSELTEPGLDQRGEKNYDNYDPIYGSNKNHDLLNRSTDSVENPRYKTKESYKGRTPKRHSSYEIDLDVDRLLPNSNGIKSNGNGCNRHKRSSVNPQALYTHQNDLASSLDQSFLHGSLTRPNALRQLPPITNKEMESLALPRPSAPSPNRASPGLDSDNEDKDENDNNDDDDCGGYDDLEDEQEEEGEGEEGGEKGNSVEFIGFYETQNEVEESDTIHADNVENNKNVSNDRGDENESDSESEREQAEYPE